MTHFLDAIGQSLGRVAGLGLDCLLPPHCPSCEALVQGAARLCPDCFGRLSFIAAPFCERCGLPFKHADRTELAPLLGTLMSRAGAALLRDAEILLPVPLHRRRLAQRRYNQAALLATQLARMAGRPWLADALTRRRATTPLGTLSAAERRAAVAGPLRSEGASRP